MTLGLLAMAQNDEAPLRNAMKKVGPLNGALGKKIAAQDAAAQADAKQLQSTFEDVRKFWDSRGTADAVQFASAAATGFGEVASQIAAGKWEDAAAAQKKAASNCMGCHTAHREKAADGSWKIK
jgi:mono/diheme cytochrome c family protein